MKKIVENPEDAKRRQDLEAIDKVSKWLETALHIVIAAALLWLFLQGLNNPADPDARVTFIVLVVALAARFASDRFFGWLAAGKE